LTGVSGADVAVFENSRQRSMANQQSLEDTKAIVVMMKVINRSSVIDSA
jgi:hypothetical protein